MKNAVLLSEGKPHYYCGQLDTTRGAGLSLTACYTDQLAHCRLEPPASSFRTSQHRTTDFQEAESELKELVTPTALASPPVVVVTSAPAAAPTPEGELEKLRREVRQIHDFLRVVFGEGCEVNTSRV
jgi:hypothetical protein